MHRQPWLPGWIGQAAILLSVALAVGAMGAPGSAGPTKLKVAAALPGIVTDKGFNQAAFEALKRMEKELGAQTAFTERVNQPDQIEVMSDYARRGFDLIIGHGGEFDDAGKKVAARFPKAKVVISAGTVTGPNLGSAKVNFFQMGFMGGTVAGMATKSGKVAVIIAQKFKSTDDMLAGFTQGAKWANPQVEVASSYTGNWDDVGKAKEAALAHVAKGADVIWPILDHALIGVYDAAKEKKISAIGFTGDQLDMAPDVILTSALQNIGIVLFEMAKLVNQGKFQGKSYVYGLETPGVTGVGRWNPSV
ncbi:MAG: BMP family protein, partial [Gammaproteobacteria bacterium]